MLGKYCLFYFNREDFVSIVAEKKGNNTAKIIWRSFSGPRADTRGCDIAPL